MDSEPTESELDAHLVGIPSGHAPFAGKYAIDRLIGQGGMGIVVAARHARMGQRVAIKILSSALRAYPELVARFEREARAASALSSVHAVRVFDIDQTDDGTPFIVMELLEGRDLADVLEAEGPFPIRRAVELVLQACEAIIEAHDLGIIHRDIKPSNLFLTTIDGEPVVKVLDFGIAKNVARGSKDVAITTALAPLGTPQYMSPEQIRCARDVDARTDIWSIGITLYELLVGRTPFAHDAASACIASVAADPVPDPRTFRADLPEALVEILMRALEKAPERRFRSVAELALALAPFASPQGASVEHGRESFASHADRTVPPAVRSLGGAEPRRIRARVASMAAAAVGVAALVLAPRWGTSTTDAAAPIRAAGAIVPVAQTVIAPAVPEAEPEPTSPAPVPPPAASHVPTPVVRAVPIHPVGAPPPAPSSRSARTERSRHEIAARSAVHGGLSSPGF